MLMKANTYNTKYTFPCRACQAWARLAAFLTLPPGLFMHFGIFVQTVSAPFYKKKFLYHKIQKSETNYLIFL